MHKWVFISEKVSELSPALQAKVTKSKMVSQLLGLQQTVVKQVGATDGGVGFAAHTVGEGAKTTGGGGGGGGGGAKTPKGEPKKTTSAKHSTLFAKMCRCTLKKIPLRNKHEKRRRRGKDSQEGTQKDDHRSPQYIFRREVSLYVTI